MLSDEELCNIVKKYEYEKAYLDVLLNDFGELTQEICNMLPHKKSKVNDKKSLCKNFYNAYWRVRKVVLRVLYGRIYTQDDNDESFESYKQFRTSTNWLNDRLEVNFSGYYVSCSVYGLEYLYSHGRLGRSKTKIFSECKQSNKIMLKNLADKMDAVGESIHEKMGHCYEIFAVALSSVKYRCHPQKACSDMRDVKIEEFSVFYEGRKVFQFEVDKLNERCNGPDTKPFVKNLTTNNDTTYMSLADVKVAVESCRHSKDCLCWSCQSVTNVPSVIAEPYPLLIDSRSNVARSLSDTVNVTKGKKVQSPRKPKPTAAPTTATEGASGSNNSSSVESIIGTADSNTSVIAAEEDIKGVSDTPPVVAVQTASDNKTTPVTLSTEIEVSDTNSSSSSATPVVPVTATSATSVKKGGKKATPVAILAVTADAREESGTDDCNIIIVPSSEIETTAFTTTMPEIDTYPQEECEYDADSHHDNEDGRYNLLGSETPYFASANSSTNFNSKDYLYSFNPQTPMKITAANNEEGTKNNQFDAVIDAAEYTENMYVTTLLKKDRRTVAVAALKVFLKDYLLTGVYRLVFELEYQKHLSSTVCITGGLRTGINYEDYVQRMSKPHYNGDDFSLKCLASLLQCSIRVILKDGVYLFNSYLKISEEVKNDELVIVFNNGVYSNVEYVSDASDDEESMDISTRSKSSGNYQVPSPCMEFFTVVKDVSLCANVDMVNYANKYIKQLAEEEATYQKETMTADDLKVYVSSDDVKQDITDYEYFCAVVNVIEGTLHLKYVLSSSTTRLFYSKSKSNGQYVDWFAYFNMIKTVLLERYEARQNKIANKTDISNRHKQLVNAQKKADVLGGSTSGVSKGMQELKEQFKNEKAKKGGDKQRFTRQLVSTIYKVFQKVNKIWCLLETGMLKNQFDSSEYVEDITEELKATEEEAKATEDGEKATGDEATATGGEAKATESDRAKVQANAVNDLVKKVATMSNPQHMTVFNQFLSSMAVELQSGRITCLPVNNADAIRLLREKKAAAALTISSHHYNNTGAADDRDYKKKSKRKRSTEDNSDKQPKLNVTDGTSWDDGGAGYNDDADLFRSSDDESPVKKKAVKKTTPVLQSGSKDEQPAVLGMQSGIKDVQPAILDNSVKKAVVDKPPSVLQSDPPTTIIINDDESSGPDGLIAEPYFYELLLMQASPQPQDKKLSFKFGTVPFIHNVINKYHPNIVAMRSVFGPSWDDLVMKGRIILITHNILNFRDGLWQLDEATSMSIADIVRQYFTNSMIGDVLIKQMLLPRYLTWFKEEGMLNTPLAFGSHSVTIESYPINMEKDCDMYFDLRCNHPLVDWWECESINNF